MFEIRNRVYFDSFGRKEFDELQIGTGFVSRQFQYHEGAVTEAHVDAEKLKSTPTTQLVSQIVLSGGRTISYEYDAEERITKVVDSVDGTTEYTYDELGQLLTEVHNGTVVNSMTYDNYGNIASKNGITYTYGDEKWKDLLTSYGDQSITYDAQGNPTNYLGHTLTWEKGRQLKSFDGNTYTYNANGIRTSKTVDGVKHTYLLEGTKILKETWGENNLVPLYDNEETVCGICYNNEPFYFQKNLQGDIIAIINKETDVVARYSYDAWGVCTIVQDSSDCGIASINPFLYRGYYYDQEIGLYYLQSRYYDPVAGRFINADSAEFSVVYMGIQGHNFYCYCMNDSMNYKDTTGHVAGVDDAAILLFICLCAALMSLVSYMSTPQFRRAWADMCYALGNGMAWIANSIVYGGRAAWNWSRRQIKAATAAVSTYVTIARAHSKIKAKVKKNSRNRYWTATLRKNYVDIGRVISYNTAVKEVSRGNNVFAVTSSEAKAVAKAAYSNKKPVGPEIDKGKENTIGYYYHYHVNGRKRKGHVFFLFW